MRSSRISARFSTSEKQLLAKVASRLHRTQSDTLRVLVYEKAKELGLVEVAAPSGFTSQMKRPDASRSGGKGDPNDVGN